MSDQESIFIVRTAPVDLITGDPLAADSAPIESPGWRFAPGPSTEQMFGADQVDTDAAVYGPPRADVRSSDRIIARGDTYEVVGQPQDWGRAGTVVRLRRVTG